MTYNLGIDIGIASIGFAAVNLNRETIIDCGVHIFEAAENPKTGASLAEPRRTKRGMRRVIHRRAQRKRAIRNLLRDHGLDISDIDTPECSPPNLSVWDLRKAALERKLTDAEFARVLFHIAKRRGFQSNRKGAEPNDTEGKKALNGAVELQAAMTRAGALTVGAHLATLPKKRNGDGTYERFVTRDLLREEVTRIFEKQQSFGNLKATQKLLLAYMGDGDKKKRYTLQGDGIAFCQRPLQSSENLVGTCTLERSEKRAPKFSYTAELFILWSKLNNARIRNVKGSERALTPDERNMLADEAHKLKGGLTYKSARSKLKLSDEERFNIGYRKIKDEDNSWENIRDTAEKATFLQLSGYHALKTALDNGSDIDWQRWIGTDRDRLDQIAWVLSFEKDSKRIEERLSALALNAAQIDKLSDITNFSKTVDLSLKAIRKILPYMQEQGLTYDKACKTAGYDHSRRKNKELKKIPVFEDIRNPVVNRALAQARKVINAVITKHGMPENIIIELARDVGRNFKDRKDIEREQKKNQAYREEAKKHVAEILGIIPDNVSGEDILKYRLWKEQDGFCPYSGAYITPETLRDSVATQIDHIIPYSRSWNDSYMNKVLCLTDENQRKGNQTPFEYLGGTARWNALEAFARQLPPRKAENILTEKFDDERGNNWKDRALNDTRYMSRKLKNHLEESLHLGEGKRVQTRNGALTANLRGAWGFPDKNRRNDRHHALDAIVLACSTQGMVKRLADWNKYEARRKHPDQRPLPPKPWNSFWDDAKAAVENIFVSRMPVRKITGAAHEDTIRSIRKSDGKIIQRIKLKSLSPAALENIVDKERNIKLYNLLKERLDAHGGKADKAFAEPVYMPTNDPDKQGPVINSVRIVTSEKSGVEVQGGLASNGDMVRVDVFQKDGKYQLVPIYAHHFAQDQLPNKAIVAFKPEDEWLEVNDEDFLFSLYRNDLVRIRSKKEDFIAYYHSAHRGTGNINLRAHDNDGSFGKNGMREGIGVKTLLAFEKYTVDYFGNIFPQDQSGNLKSPGIREKRVGVAHRHDSEPCEAEPETGAVAAGK